LSNLPELIVATRDGLAAARARGREGGRRPRLTAHQAEVAQRLNDGGKPTVDRVRPLAQSPAGPGRESLKNGVVGTEDHMSLNNPEAQRDALTGAGCDEVFIDKASGKLARRPELDKALLSANRAGDQLVVTKFDRWAARWST
jgi:DNA invertase Pin-like site-specific DNA recombinase